MSGINELDGLGTIKKKKKRKSKNNKNLILIVLLVVSLLGLGTLGYLYYQEVSKPDNNTENSEEVEAVKEAVGRHYKLPDEEAAVATIVNVEELKAENPEFYKDATNGMKLLVFSNKAILYDPESDLIINVAPVFRESDLSTPTSTPDSNETRLNDEELEEQSITPDENFNDTPQDQEEPNLE